MKEDYPIKIVFLEPDSAIMLFVLILLFLNYILIYWKLYISIEKAASLPEIQWKSRSALIEKYIERKSAKPNKLTCLKTIILSALPIVKGTVNLDLS